jgi:hypothetical protein
LTVEEIEGLPGWFLTDAQRRELLRLARTARAGARGRSGSFGSPDTLDPRRPGGSAGARAGGRGAGTRRTELDIEIDIARARRTPGTGDEIRFLGELRAFQQRQIDALERRRNLNEEQKGRLRELYGAIASTQSEIDSIVEAGERETAERKERAAERRRAQREARERREAQASERERRELLEFERRTRARDLARARGIDPLSGFGGGLGGSLVDDARRSVAAQKAREQIDARRFEELSFEFLQSLRGIQNQFGSNVSTEGSPGTRPPIIVNVTQTFPEPTPDRNLEAIYMRHAVERAFQAA